MLIDKTSSRPLYEQLKDYILDHVNRGLFEPHQKIPSEWNLASRFGVSRLTVSASSYRNFFTETEGKLLADYYRKHLELGVGQNVVPSGSRSLCKAKQPPESSLNFGLYCWQYCWE